MNDVWIAWILAVFFISLAIVAPLIQAEFNQPVQNFNADDLLLDEQPVSLGVLEGSSIFFNLITMLFWSFGYSTKINLILFTPLKIALWILIIRNFPVIGSGGG